MAMDLEVLLVRSIAPPLISNLSSVTISPESRRVFLDEFQGTQKLLATKKAAAVAWAAQSEANFTAFVEHLRGAWTNYLRLLQYMDVLSPSLHNMYPEKALLLQSLVSQTYQLNQHLYFITDIEKEVYEKAMERVNPDRLPDLLSSVRSFPVYLGKKFILQNGATDNKYFLKDLIIRDASAQQLFHACGCSLEVFGTVLRNAGEIKGMLRELSFVPESTLEESLVNILAFDHFVELFLRRSEILEIDTKFYAQVCRQYDHDESFANAKASLANTVSAHESGFMFNIPQFYQTGLSCGAACLLNVRAAFDATFNPDTAAEAALVSEVTVPGYFNNVPSSLAKAARTRYGIPATFIADMSSFAPAFIANWEHQSFPPLAKFMEDYRVVPHEDVRELTPGKVLLALKQGSMIAYVCGRSPMLHYRLIYGYERNGDTVGFNVFDPSSGPMKIAENDIGAATRNDVSFWAVRYQAPESVIFASIEETIKASAECVLWKEVFASTSRT